MARPSKLSENKWQEVLTKHLHGRSISSLAKEYGIERSTVRDRVSASTAEIKEAANQILATEQKLALLPVSARVAATSLADELRAISSNLASAAKYGSMTAHRLNAIAHAQTDKIDETASLDENQDAIKSVMAYTRTANDAASIGLNLLAANKEMAKVPADEVPTGLGHFYGGNS